MTERGEEKTLEPFEESGTEMHKKERIERGKWECDREAVEQIKVKLSTFTYLDERF